MKSDWKQKKMFTSTHQGSESQQIQFSSDSNLRFRSGEPVVTVGCENEGSKVVFQAIWKRCIAIWKHCGKKTHLSSNKSYIKINSELGAKLQEFSANFTSELRYVWYFIWYRSLMVIHLAVILCITIKSSHNVYSYC